MIRPTELTEMIIVQNDAICCQLLFTPLCLLFKRMLVWVILHQTGRRTVPALGLKNL